MGEQKDWTYYFCDQPGARSGETPNLETEDMIMFCLTMAISHLSGTVIDEYVVMVEGNILPEEI